MNRLVFPFGKGNFLELSNLANRAHLNYFQKKSITAVTFLKFKRLLYTNGRNLKELKQQNTATMKKYTSIFLLSVFAALTIQAQNHSFNKFFNQFSEHPEATQVTISRPMMWLVKHFSDEDLKNNPEMEMLKSIKSFRLVSVPGVRSELKSSTKSVKNFLRRKMEPLMEIRDGKNNLTLAIHEKRGVIKEVGILVDSEDEMILIQVKGNFDLEQIQHIGGAIGDHTNNAKLDQKDIAVNAQISLYPNPASDQAIQVEYPENLVHSNYIISDLEGRVLQSGSLEQATLTIQAQNFAKGTYIFVIASGEDKKYSKKFTIN